MQWAFDVGAKKALRGGVSFALARVSGERAVLDAASRDAVPVATLRRIASRSLGQVYALRKVWMPAVRSDIGVLDIPGALAEGAQPISDVPTPVLPSVHRRRGSDLVQAARAVQRGTLGTGSMPNAFDVGRVAMQAGLEAGERTTDPFSDKATAIPRSLSDGVSPTVRTATRLHSPPGLRILRRDDHGTLGGATKRAAARDSLDVVAPRGLLVHGSANVNGAVDRPTIRQTVASPSLRQETISPGIRAGEYSTGRQSAPESGPVAPRIDRSGRSGFNPDTGLSEGGHDVAAFNGRAGEFDPEGDSNAGARQGSQMSQGASEAGGGAMQGDVFLDGALVGRWVSRLLTRDAERASVGRTGFDIRRGRLLPGPTVGAS